MKKLYFAFFFLFSFSLLSAQSGPKCDFHIRSVVDEATCWNSGTVTITAVDGSNNPLYIAPTTADPNPYNNLSTIKYGYRKISVAGDTVHWSNDNILSLDSGRYMVMAEVLCCDSSIIGEGRYTTLKDSNIVNVVLSYTLLDAYRIPDAVSSSTSRGYAPSLPCINTGREQFSITGGKFPYMIRVHNTDLDELDTIIFTGHQYTGSSNSNYNYKDYYSVDSLAPGHYDFYVEDGCGYKWARISHNVSTVEPPTVTSMTFDDWSKSATDSNVIKTIVKVKVPNRYYLKNPAYLQYRFIHKDINGITDTTEWRTFTNFGSLSVNNNDITVYDTVSNAHSYCDIRNKDIVFEAKSTLCDHPYSKTQNIKFPLDSINSVAWYYWSGSYADSNVLRAAINIRHVNNNPAALPEIKYRFIHKDPSGTTDTTEWKYYTGLASKPMGDVTIDVFDTVASAHSYCDIYGDTITIEAQLTSCENTFPKKVSHIWEKPNMFNTFSRADTVVASYVTEHYNQCGFIPTHPVGLGFPHYFVQFAHNANLGSLADKTTQNLRDSIKNFQVTYPLTWTHTDTSTGLIIKTERLRYQYLNNNHYRDYWNLFNNDKTHWDNTVSVLQHQDVEPIYGSLYDTSYTIPVRRTLTDAKGCVLYERFDNLLFNLRHVVDDYPATPQQWTAGYETNGDKGCSKDQRYVYLTAEYYSQQYSDGTEVRLYESPLGNKYNFTAVYDLATTSWNIVKDSLSNLANIIPVDYDTIRIGEYNLPSGTYKFRITNECGTYYTQTSPPFSDTYSWEIATQPSYTMDTTCTSLTITPTAGQYRLYRRNTNDSGPTESSSLINMKFQIIAKLPMNGPQNTYSTSPFTASNSATITAPGRYVIKIVPNSEGDKCSPPTLYDTISFSGGTVSFKYAMGYVCNSSSTTGFVRAKAADGTPPYTYTLYSGPDKSGTVMDANGTGVFDNVNIHSGQVVSVGIQDDCMAAFHVNMTIYEMEQLNKAWFPGDAETADVCEGHYISFYAVGLSDDVSYHWTGPDGYTSDTRDNMVFIPRSSSPGWYKVVISNTGCNATIAEDSVYVDVIQSPWVEVLRDTVVCPGQPVTVEFIPHGTGDVNYTVACRENNTVTLTHYDQPTTITFSPTSTRSYWVADVADDICSYTIADDTVKISINDHIATSCDVVTLSEPICHSTDGEVFASSALAVPYYVKWYRDAEQTEWLRTDTIHNAADYASYTFTGLTQDTSLYVTVSNSEYCESRYGTISSWKNMAAGNVSLRCGESILLFDDGGQDNNYSPDLDLFQTFTSSDGQHLTISFEALNIDPGDKLLVYSGAVAHNDSLLAELTGDLTSSLPGPFVSVGSALTLRFLSNHTTQKAGFQAMISNNPKPASADLHVLDTLSTELVIPHVQVHYDGDATVTANAEGGRGDSYRYSWEISVDGGGSWTSLGDSISGSSANLYLNHVTQPTHVRVSISDASANPCVGTAQADIFIPVSNVQLTLDLSIPDLQQCESNYPATVTVKNHKPGTAHDVTVKLGLPENVVPLNPDDTLIALGDIAGNDSVSVTINLHNGLMPTATTTLPVKAQIWSCSEGDSVPTVLYGDWDWNGDPRQADEDVDSLRIKPVMSLAGYHLIAQDDAVCYNGTAVLRATSDVDMPQYIRWYADPALRILLKTDTLNTAGESSEYTIENLVRDTTLYITIENDGFCPAIDSVATYAKLNAPATRTMNIADGSTLVGIADKIKFYDTGGPSGNYGNGENIVHTFTTSSGQVVLRLNSITIGAGDRFFIYDGPTATGAPIYLLLGSSNSNAQVFTSTGGTLTVAMYSNGTSVEAGWDADVASSTNYLSAVATASLRTVYEDATLTATDDTVCVYNDAVLTARSDNAIYFTWLAGDQKTVVLQDTTTSHESTLPLHYVLKDSTYYVAATPAGACPVIPTSMEREMVLNLASSNTGRETHLLPTDRVRFFDDGGASSSYLPEKHVFTHTFTGLQGKVKLTFANNGMLNTADTLYVYDGTIGSGTLMGKYTNTDFRNKTFTSTTNQLSVKFANKSGSSNIGWDATVTTSNEPHIVPADVTIKLPLTTNFITATNDTVCYDNTATLHASSNIAFPQYYSWYKDDGKTLLHQDTAFASGDLSTFRPEHQVRNSLYYVTIYNDTTCPYQPTVYGVYLKKNISKIVRGEFRFNSSKNGGTTSVRANDSIPFYDEGGPNSKYSTGNITWTHTFTSQTGNVVLRLDEFNSQSAFTDYLTVYEGSTTSGRTIRRIGGSPTYSGPIILTSSGNSLTVQWTTDNDKNNNWSGWKGSVYSTYNDTLLAPSTVHIKAPLTADYITATHDTVCYDNTATLHASSHIAFPQYYSWYKDDGKTLLHQDTASASGEVSTFQPEHQVKDSLYYVAIYNDTTCPFVPNVTMKTVREDFLFNSSKNGKTTFLTGKDSIPFFDEGGPDYSPTRQTITWTHTFTAYSGHVILRLDKLGLCVPDILIPLGGSGSATRYYPNNLTVYDGNRVPGPIIGAGNNDQGYVDEFSTGSPKYFISSGNSLTVKIIMSNDKSPKFGWEGAVYTSEEPDSALASSTVHIKEPLTADYITATHDTVCYDNTATLHASSNIAFPQYYSWYKDDGKTLLHSDTAFTTGDVSIFQPEHQVRDSLYYVTIYNDTACPYLPAVHNIYMKKNVRENFFFNSDKNGLTTILTTNDSIPFYDEGGPNSNYSTSSITWTHTFTSPTGNVILELDEFYSQGTSYDYLMVYDGNTASGRTLGGNSQGRIGGYISSSALPIILTSSGNSLTVQWVTDYRTNQTGWKGSVYSTNNDTIVAPSTVHIKTPLKANCITATHDTVCYDNTATLKASSDIAFPQYYSWYKNDGKTLLHQDTAFASGYRSSFQPKHQVKDSLYYVAIYNDTTCPYLPAVHDIYLKKNVRENFLFNSDKNGGTTYVTTNDSIPFYDEGGPSGNYSTNSITWTHTFTSQTGNVILKLDDFYSQGTSYDYLKVYDGSTASGSTLGGDSQGRIGGYLKYSCPIILTSSGNSMTIQWTTNASTNRSGWIGSVYSSYIDTILAPSAVHIKEPLQANYITTTHDTICYDHTATLHASSTIGFPQYYSWYKNDTTLLYQDTVQVGNVSSFYPKHQIIDSMYYVTIYNDTACPFVPKIRQIKKKIRNNFLFDIAKENKTTFITTMDSIPFFDNGGPDNNYYTYSNEDTIIHTFIAPNGQNLILRLNKFNTEFYDYGDSLDNILYNDYLTLYDGDSDTFPTINYNSSQVLGGDYNLSSPIILKSTGNSLTIRWYAGSGYSSSGWEGFIYTTGIPDSILATSSVKVCPVNVDTVYQATCQSSTPYNYDNFHNIDVSLAGTFVIDSLYQNQYGCDSTVTLILTVNPAPVLSATSSSHCRNLSDGYIDLSVGAGNPPFEIQWSGKVSGSHTLTAPGSYRIENLPDSIYDITVTDVKGCSATLKDTVSQIDDTLTITANSHAFDYDGTAHSDNGFTVDFDSFSSASASGTVTLPNGDIVNATITGSITEVSESPKPNTVTAYSVYRGADDVTCEYAVKTIDGQLTINAVSAPLRIQSPSCEWDYNGKYDSCTTTYTVTFNGTDVPECTACTPPAGSWQYVLPTNDTITISDPIRVRDVTDTSNTFTLHIQNGTTYTNVDTVYGNIRIKPINLTISTDSSEKIFDGLPLTAHSWLNTPPVGLAPGDTVVWVDIYGSITNMGDSLNRAHPIAIVVNTSTGDTVTGNYNISYNFGTLSVYGALSVLAAAHADSIQSVTCNGSDDGSGTFVIVGGKPGAHTYSLDGGIDVTITSDTIKLTHLTSGNHTLAVTDLMGNTDTLTFTVGSPEPLVAHISVPTNIADRCPNQGTYTVTVNVTGGTKPYNFVWGKDANNVNDTITTVTQTLANDCGKEYEVTILVTDSNLCTAKDTARFSVIDTVKPTFAVPGDTTLYLNSACSAVTDSTVTGKPTALADNCTPVADLVVKHSDTETPGCGSTKTIVRTWTVTDACGNVASKTQTISVLDSIKPTITTTLVDSTDKGCNWDKADAPTAADFTVNDECKSGAVATVTTTGETHTGCSYAQTWIANYTDDCGLKATPDTITYTWTVDTEKPVIASTAVSGDLGCNPGTITAPTFTVTDNCEGSFTLDADSVTVTGPTNSGCSYTQSWTAHYTDACGNKAKDSTITYTWTVDTEKPVISSSVASADLGCNPGTITAPTFTVTDNCEGSFTLTADSVTVTGPDHTGCDYTQSWTAHYTDACGNKAKDSTITYTWTETTTPTITTTLTDKDFSCIAMMVPPTVSDFTVNDACNTSATVTLTEGPETVTGYVHSKTWTATYKNSCNIDAAPVSITYKWKDATTVTITCPPNVYDTLDFGECEMKVSITKLGYPTTSITPPGTPFGVTNDFPADSVFSEGDNLVSWIIIDSVCGYTDTCFQHILITFPKCPDAVDCEGNVYHGVRIDCDCWTQRNLESKKYSDCTDIPCVYEYHSETHPDVTENVDRYGRLYCYEAAVRDSADNGHGHIQGICPAGWYLPTPEKYVSLNLHGADALKSPLYWVPSGGSNTTGFTALPAGKYNGTLHRYEDLLGEAYFWSTAGVGSGTSISAFTLYLDCSIFVEANSYEGLGYSVRCIKEKEK